MPVIWTLAINLVPGVPGIQRTLAELQVYGMRLNFRNLATDTMTWSIALPSLNASLAGIPKLGQEVLLNRSGATFFHGVLTGRRQVGRRMDLTVSGPWWWLENEFLNAPMYGGDGQLALRNSYAIPRQSLTLSLRGMLLAAAGIGIPLSVGALADTYTAPIMRLNLTSYAQAVAELVRMTPDMVLWWDYSVYPAQARTSRRLKGISGTADQAVFDAGQCKDFDLSPLINLEVTQVQAPFLAVDGLSRVYLAGQTAGTAAPGKVQMYTVSGTELGTEARMAAVAVVAPPVEFTLQCVGAIAKLRIFPNFKQAIDTYGDVAVGDGLWTDTPNGTTTFYERAGGPKGVKKYDNFQQQEIRIMPKDGSGDISQSNQLKLYLGDLPDWAILQLKPKRVVIKGIVTRFLVRQNVDVIKSPWKPERPDLNPPLKLLTVNAGVNEGFLRDIGDRSEVIQYGWIKKKRLSDNKFHFYGACFIQIRLYVEGWIFPTEYRVPTIITKTPLSTDITAPGTAPEAFRSPPSDFAAGLLAAQNYIPYSGKVSIVEDEVGAARYMNKAFNFVGAQPEHWTIRAMVTEESLELATGITTIYLGPPARYNYGDLVSRMRPDAQAQVVRI